MGHRSRCNPYTANYRELDVLIRHDSELLSAGTEPIPVSPEGACRLAAVHTTRWRGLPEEGGCARAGFANPVLHRHRSHIHVFADSGTRIPDWGERLASAVAELQPVVYDPLASCRSSGDVSGLDVGTACLDVGAPGRQSVRSRYLPHLTELVPREKPVVDAPRCSSDGTNRKGLMIR